MVAPGIGEFVLGGSLRCVFAGFLDARAGPQSDEGQERPLPRQGLVAGDLDFLIQNLQFPVAGQSLIDQTGQQGIIEKLFESELGGIVRAIRAGPGRSTKFLWHVRSRFRLTLTGD